MLETLIHHLGWADFLAFAFIYGLLLLGTLIVFFINLNSKKDHRELSQRIFSWWVIIILFSIALSINTFTIIIFFAFISYLALKEFFTIMPTRSVDRRVLFCVYLALPLQYFWVAERWYGMFVIFIPLYLFLFIPFRMVTIGETKGFLRASGTLHWAVMITVYCVSYIAFLGVLPQGHSSYQTGLGLILYLTFLTQFNDVAQYCWGKACGKRKIAPKISPNKTMAGFIGGVITTTFIACLIYPYFTPFNFLLALCSGIIISLSGFLGDLSMSAIKRDLGIKDTGNLLPGHGGILDRMDSLIFAAPLFFHFVRYFYY